MSAHVLKERFEELVEGQHGDLALMAGIQTAGKALDLTKEKLGKQIDKKIKKLEKIESNVKGFTTIRDHLEVLTDDFRYWDDVTNTNIAVQAFAQKYNLKFPPGKQVGDVKQWAESNLEAQKQEQIAENAAVTALMDALEDLKKEKSTLAKRSVSACLPTSGDNLRSAIEETRGLNAANLEAFDDEVLKYLESEE